MHYAPTLISGIAKREQYIDPDQSVVVLRRATVTKWPLGYSFTMAWSRHKIIAISILALLLLAFADSLDYPFACRSERSLLGQPLVDNQVGAGTAVYALDEAGCRHDARTILAIRRRPVAPGGFIGLEPSQMTAMASADHPARRSEGDVARPADVMSN